MKNIVLIGMMGCGKSTVGRLLAAELGLELADTDRLIESWEGRSVSEIFQAEGDAYFRDLELGAAEELARRSGLVIACGGGLPMRPDCIGSLKYSGTVFFLNRDPGQIFDTVSMKDRPLGQEGREAFLARFAAREPVYRQWADYVIDDFASPQTTARAIREVMM